MHEIEQFYREVIDLLNITLGWGGAEENERDLLILTF